MCNGKDSEYARENILVLIKNKFSQYVRLRLFGHSAGGKMANQQVKCFL